METYRRLLKIRFLKHPSRIPQQYLVIYVIISHDVNYVIFYFSTADLLPDHAPIEKERETTSARYCLLQIILLSFINTTCCFSVTESRVEQDLVGNSTLTAEESQVDKQTVKYGFIVLHKSVMSFHN